MLLVLFYLIILAISVFFGVRYFRKPNHNVWVIAVTILLVIGLVIRIASWFGVFGLTHAGNSMEEVNLVLWLIILAIPAFFLRMFLRKASHNAWITTGVIVLTVGIGILLAVSINASKQSDSELAFGIILGLAIAGPGLWILLTGFSRKRLLIQAGNTPSRASSGEPPPQSKCEKCGYWNQSTAEFCSKCGNKLT